MKKILPIIMCLIIAFAAFGCGDNKSNYDENGFMTLKVWAGDEYVGSTGEKMKAFLKSFEESEAGKELKVKFAFQSMSSLPSSLNTASMTGKNPDLVIWDRFSTPSYSYLLQDLNEFIEKDSIDTSVFLPEAYNELTHGEGQYGLPMDLDTWGIYINMDLVNEYNAKESNTEKINVDDLGTWSKVMAAAEKLTQKEDNTIKVSGINTTSMDGNFFSFVYTGGGELINTDKSSPTYGDTTLAPAEQVNTDANSKRVYDTLSYFKTLYNKKLCDNGHGGTDAFVNNKLAMTFGSIYFKQNIKDVSNVEKNMKIIPFPKRDMSYVSDNYTIIDPAAESNGLINGQYGGVLGGYGLAISKPAAAFENKLWKERRDKSWEVIKKWMFDDEVHKSYFTMNEQITARTDMHEDEFYKKDGNIKEILPFVQYYKMRPSVEGYEQFEANIVRAQIQSMYEGATSLTIYKKIREEGNSLLKEYQGR